MVTITVWALLFSFNFNNGSNAFSSSRLDRLSALARARNIYAESTKITSLKASRNEYHDEEYLVGGRDSYNHHHSKVKGKDNNNGNQVRRSRRSFLHQAVQSSAALMTGLTLYPPNSIAGEVGARITKAVTTSDLGISVRTSVVKGAQLMDKLDGQWEKFSDENNLGAERLKAGKPPKPAEVPLNRPLNYQMAQNMLRLADESFLEVVNMNDININMNMNSNKNNNNSVSREILERQIEKVDRLVRVSFERSGLNLKDATSSSNSGGGDRDTSAFASVQVWTADQFNYYCYCHFKAYCDILIDTKTKINRREFENILGDKLLTALVPTASKTLNNLQSSYADAKEAQMSNAIATGLSLTDEIVQSLITSGFVALATRNDIDGEKINDWTEDLSDIALSIPLDGDVTLKSQLLLQEQGFRLYPDFGRFAITSALQQSLKGCGQSVSSDEYYMDTNYNSDPDLFEVKQVLLNIVIDSV